MSCRTNLSFRKHNDARDSTESGKGSSPEMKNTSKRSLVKGHDQPISKRQKRLKPNDKHAWAKQPKLTSLEARSRAHIRVAGLDPNQKMPSTLSPTSLFDNTTNQHEMKFGRLLGSTDQRTRHATIRQLSNYLKARTDTTNPNAGGLSELDLLKLWKGIWFCFYMSDKVPVQHELSSQITKLLFSVAGTEEEDEYAGKYYMEMFGDEDDIDENESSDGEELQDVGDDKDDSGRINGSYSPYDEEEEEVEVVDDEEDEGDDVEMDSNGAESSDSEDHAEMDIDDNDDEDSDIDSSIIRHCRGAHLAALFVRTFFATIRREWGNMDKYRVDKFYTLMRDMLRNIYEYMAMRYWNLGVIRLFNDAMYEEVFSKIPNGLRYHIIDIALDEMANVNSSAKAVIKLTEATFIDVFEPFFAMSKSGAGGNDPVQKRVVEHFLEKFLLEYSVVSENSIQNDAIINNKSTENTANHNERKARLQTAVETTVESKTSNIFDNVHVRTIADFIFEMATDPETHDRYRKSLYDIHKLYIRKIRGTGRDVDITVVADECQLDEDASITDGQIANASAIEDTKKAAKNESTSKAKRNRKHQGLDGWDAMPSKNDTQNAKHFAGHPKEKNQKNRSKQSLKAKKENVTNTEGSFNGSNNHVEAVTTSKKTETIRRALDNFESSMKPISSVEKGSMTDFFENGGKSGISKPSVQKNSKTLDSKGESNRSNTRTDVDKTGRKMPNTSRTRDLEKKPEKRLDQKNIVEDDSNSTPKENSKEMSSGNSTLTNVYEKDMKAQKMALKASRTSTVEKRPNRDAIQSNEENCSEKSTGQRNMREVRSEDGTNGKDKTKKGQVASASHELRPSVKPGKQGSKTDTSKGEEKGESSGEKSSLEEKSKDKSAATRPNEEIITISLQDQGLAKNVMKRLNQNENTKSGDVNKFSKKDSTKANNTKEARDENREYRVKFSEFNKARSFKVSIKNLNNMKSPVTKVTPERGILRNKEKVHRELLSKNIAHNMNKNPKRRNRKKATDFF